MIITHFSRLIHLQAAKHGNEVVFRHKDYTTQSWAPTTWAQFAEKVMKVAKAMAALGIKEQDCCATYTQNKPEGLIVDFAAYANRAVIVPLYATSSVNQVEYILNDSASKIIFVGEQFQYDNAIEAIQKTASCKQIIVFDNSVKLKPEDKTTIYLDQFMKQGESAGNDKLIKERMDAAKEEDLANLIYTSGTTGEPKGVMLAHSNFLFAMRIHKNRLRVSENDTSMCFLPMAHIFERTWTYFCLSMNIRVEINLRPLEVQQSLKETNPSLMCAVPRFWEKVFTAIQDKRGRSSKTIQGLMDKAFEVGRAYNIEHIGKRKKVPFGLKLKYMFYDKLILSKIRKVAGLSNGNFFPCAGAALSQNINEFLHSIGVFIAYGYGLTETTATVCCFEFSDFDFKTMGSIMPGVEVRIGEENEIQIKGGGVMKGYYNKPEETAKSFTQDGWFRTGDAGGMTTEGDLFMTERIKDLFKTANGKYIAPQALEGRIGEDRYIDQIVVIGDQRKFVSAVIVPVFDALKDWADENKIQYSTIEDLVNNQSVKDFISSRINEHQKEFASFEQVKRFTLLPKPFSMESGELTNTLKVRRASINQRYKEVIEAMYTH